MFVFLMVQFIQNGRALKFTLPFVVIFIICFLTKTYKTPSRLIVGVTALFAASKPGVYNAVSISS